MYDMATTTRQLGDPIPMSWDEFEALGPDVRGEYVDREVVRGPFPTGRHQDIVFDFVPLLKAAVQAPVRVRGNWGWKPGTDEFGPDIMVFDDTGEDKRYTGIPHLVVEILSSDPTRDIIRKATKYAAAGVERYWIIAPTGPEITVYRPVDGLVAEQGVHRRAPRPPSTPVQLR